MERAPEQPGARLSPGRESTTPRISLTQRCRLCLARGALALARDALALARDALALARDALGLARNKLCFARKNLGFAPNGRPRPCDGLAIARDALVIARRLLTAARDKALEGQSVVDRACSAAFSRAIASALRAM
jgi:hypothetical protein